MTGLVVDQATVRYGDTAAIDRFDLTVAQGEIMAVLGPSGSGKSTLLRAIAGLEPLAGGRISLDGRDLAGVPTHRRELGLMFQDHGLFSHLSVGRNIGYGLRVAGASRAAERARVDELLALVGLERFGARSPDQLSGGEAQRVALARALAPEPGLLMLDEPLGSLDRSLRDQLTGDLRRMLTEIGQTALHVTHDQSEAFAIADRVAVVANGRPVAVGSPAGLWANPGTEFVARFLGHTNIWTVEVDRGGAVVVGDTMIGRVRADHPVAVAARRATTGGRGQVTVAVPATAVTITPTAEPGEVDPIEARVTEVVFRHGLHEVTVEPEGDRSGGRDRITVVTTNPVAVGATVRVGVDGERLAPLEDRRRS